MLLKRLNPASDIKSAKEFPDQSPEEMPPLKDPDPSPAPDDIPPTTDPIPMPPPQEIPTPTEPGEPPPPEANWTLDWATMFVDSPPRD